MKNKPELNEDIDTVLDAISLGVEKYIDPACTFRHTVVDMTLDVARNIGIPDEKSLIWARRKSNININGIIESGCN